MPIYKLSSELRFPPPEGASPEGIVAIGGDASPERLVLAYSLGIFPWPHRDLPLLWFSPDPRFVITFDRTHVGRSLRKRVKAAPYEIRTDTAFSDVMEGCARTPRPGQDGTWITDDLRAGFNALHERGIAHSIEAWHEGELVGGLYGVALGRAFCGESMFTHRDDASKIATVALLGNLRHWGFHFVDCQVYTDHLSRFGAREWPRPRFLRALREAISQPHVNAGQKWTFPLDPIAALKEIDRPSDKQPAQS
ncbi:MAG TPA: leucyl/phenylalanyl-tRNA--protein transferase [Polyangiales bacterium]|jgi:leucyl/phenylalanyl-tRNA--protein transferase|nr:leucyl/phenylalanyl-tRNA--protein transferase [Polyangiales bacterium]